MNEEEKEDIELDIEAKYVDRTEKEFLSRVTYAECLYILTPKNKYCDKIRELSVLKLCEIIEKLQKENKELKKSKITYEDVRDIQEKNRNIVDNNYISKQIVKDNLIKYQEEYELLLEYQSEKESNKTKTLRGRIHMCQELLEGRK